MSTFLTPLPVNLAELTSLLPPGSTVDKIEWDKAKSQLVFTWSTDKFKSPYHVMDFPLSNLQEGTRPAGVVDKAPPTVVVSTGGLPRTIVAVEHPTEVAAALAAIQSGNPGSASKASLGALMDSQPKPGRRGKRGAQ